MISIIVCWFLFFIHHLKSDIEICQHNCFLFTNTSSRRHTTYRWGWEISTQVEGKKSWSWMKLSRFPYPVWRDHDEIYLKKVFTIINLTVMRCSPTTSIFLSYFRFFILGQIPSWTCLFGGHEAWKTDGIYWPRIWNWNFRSNIDQYQCPISLRWPSE